MRVAITWIRVIHELEIKGVDVDLACGLKVFSSTGIGSGSEILEMEMPEIDLERYRKVADSGVEKGDKIRAAGVCA